MTGFPFFLRMKNVPLYVYINITLCLIHSTVCGLLDCFHLLVTMNRAAMNVNLQISLSICLVFQKTAKLFSKTVILNYITMSSAWKFQFFHILINIMASLINFSSSFRHAVVPHCGFNLHLPNDWQLLSLFHVLIAIFAWVAGEVKDL